MVMVGHIDIHGEIGSRVTLETVKSQIQPGCSEYIVHLSSEGGEVYEGIKIYHELKKLQNLTVIVEGLAASIATLIMQAGIKIIALRPSDIMIHNPMAGVQGDSKDFMAAAEQLNRIKDTLISVYKTRTKLNDKALAEMMDKETWMNADEAMAAGFIDEVKDRIKAVASIDITKFKMDNTDKIQSTLDGWFKKFEALFIKSIKNIDLTLMDGTVVTVDTEDPNDLMNKPIKGADGAPLPDGEYELGDGRELDVAGGMIVQVNTDTPVDKQTAEALKAENEQLKAELAKATQAAAKATSEAAATAKAMTEFKNQFTTLKAEMDTFKNQVIGDKTVPGAHPDATGIDEGKIVHPVMQAFFNEVAPIFTDKLRLK